MIDRLLDAEVKVPEKPTEEELETYYRANLDQFMAEEEVRVSQIFIEPSSHEAAREAFIAPACPAQGAARRKGLRRGRARARYRTRIARSTSDS